MNIPTPMIIMIVLAIMCIAFVCYRLIWKFIMLKLDIFEIQRRLGNLEEEEPFEKINDMTDIFNEKTEGENDED